ncbi:hypothetical protein [Geobacillus zalihae]|nr:hypothetical protein [Geobacillus zalihae]
MDSLNHFIAISRLGHPIPGNDSESFFANDAAGECNGLSIALLSNESKN